MENFYLDDNVGIEKNIAVELFLTDEEIKNDKMILVVIFIVTIIISLLFFIK